ncbi:MAG: M1 family metallopeptidase [Clostridia bacterium]
MLIVVFLITIILSGVGCVELEDIELDSYFFNINANMDNNNFKINQKFIFNNNEEVKSDLCFNLFANAFNEKATTPVEQNQFAIAYPFGFSAGGIKMNSIKCEKKFSESYENNKQFLTLKFDKKIKKHEKLQIEFDYDVTVPNNTLRFGYNTISCNIANFYPQLCVRENKSWQKCNYFAIGDPFYSEVANYEAVIEYPKNYLMLSSGEAVGDKVNSKISDVEVVNSNTTISKISAPKIRDFAFVLSNYSNITKSAVDGIEINYMHNLDKSPLSTVKTIENALSIFNRLFGKYPYKVLNVCQTNFLFGGMEYPNIIYVNCLARRDSLDYVTVHEIAHQWWYGVVGNNEIKNAWQDEAITEFSCVLYYLELGEVEKAKKILKDCAIDYEFFVAQQRRVNKPFCEIMDRGLDAYDNSSEYTINVYTKGMMMFAHIFNIVGKQAFIQALKEYYILYQFKNATPQQFIACFTKNFDSGIKNIFNAWLNGKVILSSNFSV